MTITKIPLTMLGAQTADKDGHRLTYVAANNAIELVPTTDPVFSISDVSVVTDSRYTNFLLQADPDGTDNQVDASTSAHTITENGNVTSTAFSPYHPGGYSVEFNSADASVTIPAATGSEYRLGPDTGWTLEFWINSRDFAEAQIVYLQRNAQVAQGTIISIATNGVMSFYQGDADNDNWEVILSCGTITADTWHHVAIVRNGSGSNNFTSYLDGTQQNQATWSGSSVNKQVAGYIGGGNSLYNSDAREFVGFLRDFRYSEEAVYTSDFTAPTEPLTVLATTKLLYFNGEPYIADKASVYGAPTVTSNVRTVRVGPYNHYPYTKAGYGGSVYFDGNGDYIAFPDDNGFELDGDFTIELWFYKTASISAGANTAYGALIGGNSSPNNGWTIYITTSNGTISFFHSSFLLTYAEDVHNHRWYHVAVTRSGTDLKLFVNGIERDSATNSTTLNQNQGGGGSRIGYDVDANGYFPGYISDVRVVKGTAVYTSAFTPPTSPLTAVTNTQLLTCTNKNKFYDASGSLPLLTAYNNITTSTSEVAYTGTSLYIPGRSDYISLDGREFKAGQVVQLPNDFTLELECKLTSSTMSYAFVLRLQDDSGNNDNAIIRFGDSGYGYHLAFVINNGGGSSAVYNINLVQSDFTTDFRHIAWTRESGVNRIFVDGVQYNVATGANPSTFSSASWTDSTKINFNGSSGIRVGYASYSPLGYFQNIRITNGLARYTAAFTAPTAEFTG